MLVSVKAPSVECTKQSDRRGVLFRIRGIVYGEQSQNRADSRLNLSIENLKNDRFSRSLHPFPVPLPPSMAMLSTRNAAMQKLWRGRHFATKVVPSPTEKKTIYALSTPPGRGGIGVIRVSGPDALDVYSQMVHVRTGGGVKGKQKEMAPEPWKMRRCSIVHPQSREVLDEGIAVFFQGPSSIFSLCHGLP